MRTYSSYIADIPRIINNSLADNITWATQMINDSLRLLIQKYYFNERTYTTSTIAQQQFYNLPPQVKKLINLTVTIGSVKWQPEECPSRQYWDALNTITFYQDFPRFFFVFNGQVGIFPIPSTTGSTITMNYKIRPVDLSMADVTNTSSGATVAVSANTIYVTTTTNAFKQWMVGQYIHFPHSTTDANNGDNQWYQIYAVSSTTNATLYNPYTGSAITAGAFTIGEVPILPEDYQDLPLYRMAMIYYTTRFPDPIRAQQYTALYETGIKKLDEEFGSKTTSVVLTDTDAPVYNPNLFVREVS